MVKDYEHNKCPKCGNTKWHTSKFCRKCYHGNRSSRGLRFDYNERNYAKAREKRRIAREERGREEIDSRSKT